MKLIKRTKKGFTIVELVIVIAVIAVLAAVLIPTFINLTNKANKAADDSLVTSLNKALAIEEVDHDVDNMHDAVECLKREGYLASALVTKSNQKLLYSLEENRFLLEEDKNEGVYQGTPDYKFWTIQDSYDVTKQQYSIYAADNFNVAAVSGLKVGFDAGDCKNVTSVAYVGIGETQNVVIRTNSSATKLNVNAPVDTVRHFGVAGVVDITSIAATSYHENGTVSLAKIKNGRLVVTEAAEIAGVHVVETDGNYNGIKVAVVGNAQLPAFTRDKVTLAAEQSKLVIEVQTLQQESAAPTAENTQYVWITGVGENEVSSSVSSSSTSATAAVTTESAIATAVKTEARESISAEELEQLEEAASRFAGGIGTEAKPYLIKTEEHFNSLNEDVNNSATAGVYYKLTSDLSFDDYGMIGSVLYTSHGEQSGEVDSITSFNGHFDGNNHTISYSITKSSTIASNVSTSGGAGLFACIEEATVKDLTINANINWTSNGYVGGLAGVLCNCQITNVTVNGTIRGYKAVGGFAGFGYTFNNDNPTSFTNCVNNAQIIASYDTTSSTNQYVVAGGFIGEGSVYNYNGSWGGSLDNRMTFDNCRNNGSFKYLGTNANSIACFSNFIGFSSDAYYGSFYFNNCSAGAGVSYEGTLATQRTVSNKTILTGYSTTNVALAPTIKYIGITSNVWGGTTAKNAIYVDGVLVEGSTGDHIQVNG